MKKPSESYHLILSIGFLKDIIFRCFSILPITPQMEGIVMSIQIDNSDVHDMLKLLSIKMR